VLEVSQGLAEDTIPLRHWVQLLRSDPQLVQKAGDLHIGPTCFVPPAMRAADAEGHLAGMLGPPRDRRGKVVSVKLCKSCFGFCR
jgi:hypothetical protein